MPKKPEEITLTKVSSLILMSRPTKVEVFLEKRPTKGKA